MTDDEWKQANPGTPLRSNPRLGMCTVFLIGVLASTVAQGTVCDGTRARQAVVDVEYSAWFCAFSLERFGASVAPNACETVQREIDVVRQVYSRGCDSFINGPSVEERQQAYRALDYLQQQLIRTRAKLP